MKAVWALMCVVGVSGCVADMDSEAVDPPAIEAQDIVGQFSPYLFAFYTTVQDDGRQEAGGWQEASARLEFPSVRLGLTCNVKVGMPLRTAHEGLISHDKAAELTALVATAAASGAYRSRPRWVGPEFCDAWHDWMRKIFRRTHPKLGARVDPR